MEKNIIETTDMQGNTVTYTQSKTGLPPAYKLAAGIGAAGLLYLMTRKGKNGGRSFFGKYITPFIMAAAYKKIMEVVEKTTQSREAEVRSVQPA